MSTNHEGGCLCGAVRYRVGAMPVATSLCHCRSCRLASGGPTQAWAVFRSEDVRWIRGAPKLFASSHGVTRGFCADCGTALTYATTDRQELIDITSATFDDPAPFAPAFEIWVDQEIPWPTELPRYPRSSREPGAQPLPPRTCSRRTP